MHMVILLYSCEINTYKVTVINFECGIVMNYIELEKFRQVKITNLIISAYVATSDC